MRRLCVDLFSGTGSFTKRAVARGFPVESYDLVETPRAGRHHQHLQGDVRNADLPGRPFFLWASPPCEGFSVAAIGRAWEKAPPGGRHSPKSDTARLGLALLAATAEAIARTSPTFWAVENPRGMMRNVFADVFGDVGLVEGRDFVRRTVTYCQYGDEPPTLADGSPGTLPRMKPTDIWTNVADWKPRPHCKNGDPCHVSAPRGARTGTQGMNNYLAKSRVPEELLDEILDAAGTPEHPGARLRGVAREPGTLF